MTDQERLDDHERRINRLERNTAIDYQQHIQTTTDHAQRIDALERLSRADLWASVAIGGYQQALTQVQEGLRDIIRRVEGIEGREVLGLSAEDKTVLINILNDVSREVDAIRVLLATRATGGADA